MKKHMKDAAVIALDLCGLTTLTSQNFTFGAFYILPLPSNVTLMLYT